MEEKPDVAEDRTADEDFEVPDLPDENLPEIGNALSMTGDDPLATDSVPPTNTDNPLAGNVSVTGEAPPKSVETSKSGSVETLKSDQPPDLSAPERVQPIQSRSRATEAQIEEYERASRTYEQLKVQKEEIESEMKRTQETMSRLAHIVLPPVDPNENQRVIIRYIERQKQIRVDRATRRNAVLQGLKLHDILPGKGSRLDESMARKRGFGLKRPSYPVKT